MTAAETAATVPPERVELVRELLRRAILTLGAIPDPDLRFRVGPKTAWPAFVQETRDAYGSSPPKIRAFTPSEYDLSVFLEILEWLRWYRQQGARGEENARLITAWVMGAPIWMLQERCSTNRRQPASQRTVYDRLDRVVTAIALRFASALDSGRFDKLHELQQFRGYPPYGGKSAQTDANDLPKSLKYHREPDAKPLGFLHPDAIAARQRDRESERIRRRANRRKGRGDSSKKRKKARKR